MDAQDNLSFEIEGLVARWGIGPVLSALMNCTAMMFIGQAPGAPLKYVYISNCSKAFDKAFMALRGAGKG